MMNVPNTITIIRILLIPFFIAVILLDFENANYAAAFIFLMLAISDYIDGYIARKKKQVTDAGKLLDPIADKIMVLSALFLLTDRIPLWISITIAFREVLLTVIRIRTLRMNIVVPANFLGKSKTVLQIIAIMLVLLELPFAGLLVYLALAITIISGIDYIIKIKRMTKHEIINIPNGITLLRLVLIIPFVYYLDKGDTTTSLILFAVIAASEKLDGISARMTNQTTEFGSGFDSFTDWTFIITIFSYFAITNQMGYLWIILLIIPGIANAIVKMAYAKRRKKVPITIVAKLAVAFTYLTIFSILINFRYQHILMAAMIVGLYISMAVYLIKYTRSASLS